MATHPELGFFDEGLDLTDQSIYASASRPFGHAAILPPVAYRSEVFADLENEKIWTRAWICIGSAGQIPNAQDLFPFTVGNHGIHVQRTAEGGLVGRFNLAQHGGCRFVPAQCQTGRKTKCSFTSCGHSRDRNVIPASELGDETPMMRQYIGYDPGRLWPVKVGSWGLLIFVNLDQACDPIETTLNALAADVGAHLHTGLKDVGGTWVEYRCNWKLAGSAFMERYRVPFSVEDRDVTNLADVAATAATHARFSIDLSGYPQYQEGGSALPYLDGLSPAQRKMATFCWLFPNLLLVLMPDHVVSVVMQPTSMTDCLQRIRLYVSAKAHDTDATSSEVSTLLNFWQETLATSAARAVTRQAELDAWGTPSRPEKKRRKLPRERSRCGYEFQRYLVNRLLAKHTYYWNAPLIENLRPRGRF